MNMSLPNLHIPVNRAEVLVEHLGLLMQVPAEVRRRAKAPLAWMPSVGQTDLSRTCIDRGTGLMITLRTGYGEGVGIASAAPTGSTENTRHWKRWCLSDPQKTGEGLIFGVPCPGDLTRALEFVDSSAHDSMALSELLTRGTVYMATRSEPETGSSWISVGLDRRQSPRAVLAALHQPGIWSQVSAAMSALIGRPITEGSRPWSIALPVAGGAADRSVLRIGSTLWGRLPETSNKSTRLAQQVANFGTDQRRVESLYSLVAGHNAQEDRVGVAVEYEFENEALVGALFTLRVPVPLPGNTPQFSEMTDGQD